MVPLVAASNPHATPAMGLAGVVIVLVAAIAANVWWRFKLRRSRRNND
jgi:hypothetical protein